MTKREAYRQAQAFKRVIRSRLDCLIFFEIVANGWGIVERSLTADGKRGYPNTVYSPLSESERLNFPTRHRMVSASKRVRAQAGEEVRQYKARFREFKEARTRWKATRTKLGWQWYVHGDGNRSSVAYKTMMAQVRKMPPDYARRKYNTRYFAYELLPRLDERKRARREVTEAWDGMIELRDLIFARMDVPVKFRR